MSAWPVARLGALVDSRPSPSVASDGDATVTAVTSGCLTSSGWSEAGLKTARMRVADVARGTLVPGEVLVSRSNTGDLVGRVAVFPGSTRRIVATDLIYRLAVDATLVLPDYLALRLRALQLHGYWRDRSSGASSTMKKITRTQLSITEVPLPPLDEQRLIATRLRDQLAISDPVRLGIEGRLETFARVREEVLASTFARIEAPPIALGAAVSAPGAIADGPFGSHLKTEHYARSGVRVIRLQNIGSGAFLDNDRAFVTPEHAESLTRHSARLGDVVVAALGDGARPAGRACQVPEIGPALVKADCFRVRTDDSSIDPGFLVWFLNSPRTQATIAGQMRGATRPRVTLAMLRILTIPLPPLDEQRSIAARLREQLAEIDRAKAALEAQRKAVDALPAALLRDVFGPAKLLDR